jgi:hypothetical protein
LYSPESHRIVADPVDLAALPHELVAKLVSIFENHGLEKEFLARDFGGCA